MSDIEKFFDRWNTKGGVVIGAVIAIFFGFAFQKVVVAVGVDELEAGLATTAIYFTGVCVWTFTYFTRVATKSTTYAEQLRDYDKQVMLARLSELDDDEIDALCAEVGVTEEELTDTVASKDEKLKNLTQKEKVLEIFKASRGGEANDPRGGV